MAIALRLLSASLLAVAHSLQVPFCNQELPDTTSNLAASFDLVFVQAPLESEALTPYPAEMIHAYHTALVFVGDGNESWTLEFRAEDFIHAIFPAINAESKENITLVKMDWHASTAGYCFTHGILHGQKHWTTWRSVARIPAAGVRQIAEFVQPLMVESPVAYELFSVEDMNGSSLLGDVTCGQGALAVVDFVSRTLGLPLRGVADAGELPITTVRLLARAVQAVGREEEASIVKYFGDAEQVGAGGGVIGWFRHSFDVFQTLTDTKYLLVGALDGETYYKVTLHRPYLSITYGPRNDSWVGAFPLQWLGETLANRKATIIV